MFIRSNTYRHQAKFTASYIEHTKHRFFSSLASKKDLEMLQTKGRAEMQRLYPDVMEKEFNNTMVYTLSACPPDKMKKIGGLTAKNQHLYLSSI